MAWFESVAEAQRRARRTLPRSVYKAVLAGAERGQTLPGLNLCGAGRVVCLIDPIGDVYACPFAIHETFLAGNVREAGFAPVWRESELFQSLREPQAAGACGSCSMYDACRGGCMAAKFFTGLPLAGPDPECVFGHGERALRGARPQPSQDHSRVRVVRDVRRLPRRLHGREVLHRAAAGRARSRVRARARRTGAPWCAAAAVPGSLARAGRAP